MRNVLVLGGTSWLGGEILRAAVAQGDAVTCLARGVAGSVPGGARLVVADRAEPGAYDAVRDQDWDDVIEISWVDEFVAGALEALAPRARHWTLVSTVSVYASHAKPDANETDPLVELTETENTYGLAKVIAERATSEAVGDRLLIARPGLIVGPGDRSDRFGYWVSRMALAGDGPILVPNSAGLGVQVIDVRDAASWLVSAGERSLTGTIDVLGDQHFLAETLARAAAIVGYSGSVVVAPESWLVDRGVNWWMGPRSLPLWVAAEDSAIGQRDNSRYRAAEGPVRDFDEIIRDVLADERARGLDRPRKSGLTRDEELALIRELQILGQPNS
jgi:nucleoside-diphosphate-sugar epimerase